MARGTCCNVLGAGCYSTCAAGLEAVVQPRRVSDVDVCGRSAYHSQVPASNERKTIRWRVSCFGLLYVDVRTAVTACAGRCRNFGKKIVFVFPFVPCLQTARLKVGQGEIGDERI